MKKLSTLSPKTSWLLTGVLFLLATMGLHLLCQMVGTLDFTRWRFSSYFHHPTIFLLNLLPVALLMFFFYFITNRAWLSFLISGVLTLTMEYINYFKVSYRGDPFVAEDLFLASEAAKSVTEITLEIPTWFWFSIFLLVAGTATLFFLAKGRIPKKFWWTRVLGALLCVGMAFGAWKLWYTDMNLYNIQLNYGVFTGDRDSEYQASHGFFWSFLRSVYLALPNPPEGYSEDQVQELLSAYEDVPIAPEEQVNVVALMLESYSDFSELEGIEFTADPYVEFHALQKECYHGTLIADIIGGGTVNSERAFLTGFSYPQPAYRRPTSSYVRYFKALGYETDGSHPGYDWFYNRKNINTYLGFDRYLLIENYYGALSDEEHTSDPVLLPELRKIYLEQTADKEPYFSFSLTYQNHCPYESTRLLGEEYVARGSLSEENYFMLNNYLHGIAETGRELAEYVDSFRNDEAPVVLVLFGDHKPSLGENNSCFAELGLDVTETSAEGCYNLYSTPYLIWANDAAKEVLGQDFTGEGNTISPCFLMAELFDCCGWEGPSWMQYQRSVRDTVSVLQRQTMYMENGVLTNTLSPEAQALLKDYEMVEYYMRTKLYDYSTE
ncbi:MAG: LTA synthase family protein [Oscillospiraceae bacterium]|nr:LTA synthase family protein [Oscillospiraceae bacterium]